MGNLSFIFYNPFTFNKDGSILIFEIRFMNGRLRIAVTELSLQGREKQPEFP